MLELVQVVARRLVDHIETLPLQRASNLEGAAEAAQLVVEDMPELGGPLEPLLDLLFERLLSKGYNTAAAGALSYVTGGGIFHAAIAEFIAAATNPYVAQWGASPGCAQIEHTVVRWFCDIVGFPDTAGGTLTSGGSMANLIAVLAARANGLPENFLEGTIYVSEEAHHSVHKAVRLAGFPAGNLRTIAVDDSCRIRLDALSDTITADRRRSLSPFLVVGMAGTTGTGAVDDLLGLAALAERERLWLHVDAAYGGFFAMTERGRRLLSGIERADSIVLDPHKSLFLPFGTGCVLARRADDLRRAHQVHSHCIRDSVEIGERASATNAADLSLELTRGFRGLRVWLPFKLLGANSFRRCLDEKLDLAEYAARELRKIPGVEILGQELSTVAFRLGGAGQDEGGLARMNRRILANVNERGRVHLSGAEVRGKYAIRICVISFRAHQRIVETCLDDLRSAIRHEVGRAEALLVAGVSQEPSIGPSRAERI